MLKKLLKKHGEFDFTFKTDNELMKAEFACFDWFDYKCIRIKKVWKEGGSTDHPIKTEEDYHNFLIGNNEFFSVTDPRVESFKLYQTDHGYENKYNF
jgi:hypothetical protein